MPAIKYKGEEHEVHSGSLYYITANEVYEEYHGQYKLNSGLESEGVAAVTGTYIRTKHDGIQPVQLQSQQSNGATAIGTDAMANAEINRLQKLVASQHQQIEALRQQIASMQVTPISQPTAQPAVPVMETVVPVQVGADPFTDQLEAMAAAGQRAA